MSTSIDERRLENTLARLLWVGTAMGCSAIALGLLVIVSIHTGDSARWASWLMDAGILLLILLPVVRVAVMLAVFVRERDYRFAAAASAVLLIIALSLAVGLWTQR